MLKIVILCGGNGTRLWPLSRESFPKQFNPILGNHSLFQETLLRNKDLLLEFDGCIEVISHEQYFFLIKDQLQAIKQTISTTILESLPKNTAAAITFSALHAQSDTILLVLPSDHLITNQTSYYQSIKNAIQMAQKGFLTTFGIKPTSAHTGYGYIQSLQGEVQKFVEKPTKEVAQSYLDAGNYFWNSGMFCFQAGVFLDALKKHAPSILNTAKEAFLHATKEQDYIRIPKKQSEAIPSLSIDYALMEKSKKIFCIESTFDWNDVGSFDSLSKEFEADHTPYQNPTHLIQKESSNNFIYSSKLVATIGVHDLIVIDTIDSLLISKKGETQKVKELLPLIQKDYPHLTQYHNTTHRPWGTYSILLETSSYKIKKIVVKPNARLSLQKHLHRNEHWIIVSGTAHITLKDQTFKLYANQSTYIPMGHAHRLANCGKIDLVMIEVQMGEYLGEDDIIRIEDDFKRC